MNRWKTVLSVGLISFVLTLVVVSLPVGKLTVAILIGIVAGVLAIFMNPKTRFFRAGCSCLASVLAIVALPRVTAGIGSDSQWAFLKFEPYDSTSLATMLMVVAIVCFILQYLTERRDQTVPNKTLEAVLRDKQPILNAVSKTQKKLKSIAERGLDPMADLNEIVAVIEEIASDLDRAMIADYVAGLLKEEDGNDEQ